MTFEIYSLKAPVGLSAMYRKLHMKINLLKAGLREIAHKDPEKLKIVLIHIVKVVIQHFKVVRIIETKTCLFHRIILISPTDQP